VGGVWSKDRLYPNLVAQVKLGVCPSVVSEPQTDLNLKGYQLFNYSDTVMHPNGGDAKDPRVTGEMIHDYLQKFAEDHDLLKRIRFNSFVDKAERSSIGWRLTLRDSEVVIETEKLLICTGVTSIPNMPSFSSPTEEENAIPIIHSRDLGSAYEDIRRPSVKEVVVIGAAKSAYDAVYLLITLGKKVTWVIRTEGSGPLAILPFKVMGLMNSIAVASTRLMTHLSPSILNTKGWMYWMLQRTMPGRWCVGRFWDFLDHLSSSHAGYAAGDHVSRLKPEIERQR
jgi:cation diffusion facilitator CzcD-associated flavoprotein CzcO